VHQDGTSMPGAAAPGEYNPVNKYPKIYQSKVIVDVFIAKSYKVYLQNIRAMYRNIPRLVGR